MKSSAFRLFTHSQTFSQTLKAGIIAVAKRLEACTTVVIEFYRRYDQWLDFGQPCSFGQII